MSDDQSRPSILLIIPPPGWALLFILAAWGASRVFALPAVIQSTLGGWIIFAAGFAVSASGRLAFARAGTEVLPVSKKNSALVASGPFGVTRNPMYLGILIALLGLAVVLGTVAGFVAALAFFVFVNFISIPYEEEKMERQFGEEFRAYKKRVRRWI